MRPIVTRFLRGKNLIDLPYIIRACNKGTIIKQNKLINANSCYKFSVRNKSPINENNPCLSIMLKQLQIVKQTFNNSSVNSQRIKQISSKLQALIQQQIGFINLNQVQISKYLQKLHYPLQNLKDQLKTIINIINDFIYNIEAINRYQRNSKYQILQYVHSYLLSKPKKQNVMARLAQIIESEIKIRQTLLYYKSYSCQSNIINTHPSKFPQTWKKIYMLSYITTQQMNQGNRLLSDVYGVIAGAIMMMQRLYGFEIFYYFLKKGWRSLYSLLIYKNMEVENAKKLLNIFEDYPINKFVEFTYDSIVTNKFIYIPAEGDFQHKINIFHQTKHSIPVRVLYYKQLPVIQEKEENVNRNDYIQNILIHTHGGGFVALSSHSCQNYTRKWANQTKIPVFSIDYSMAPDHVFPQAHNDCFQVYRFLTSQLHKYMRIKPLNIFVGGDSAGANLSCAITTFSLKNQLIIPKALYLAYPLLNIESIYYPSRKYILNDPLMHPAFIKVFMKSYFPNQDDYISPLASPLLLTQQFIGGNLGDSRFPLKWPKTVIAVGTKDPLRDQSLLFMQRMTDSNIDCKCFLYQNMSHAFLSLDQLINDTSKTIDHSIQIFKEMIAAQQDNGK